MTTLDPLHESTFPIIPPSEVFHINYDLPRWPNPWNTSDIHTADNLDNQKVAWLILHHGGGPNPGGYEVDEPGLTWRQRVAVSFGRVRTVLRSWEEYHVLGHGWTGLGYDGYVTNYGQVGRARGWRRNGGQYGHWNSESYALVWVGGLGQSMTRAAWRRVGQIWLEASYGLPAGEALTLIPHSYTNYDSPAQYQTSCPGDERRAQITADQHITALGVLRVRKGLTSRKPQVKSLCRGLVALGLLDKVYSRYTANVSRAVSAFDPASLGVCGPEQWRELAAAVSLL
jgi:hypothetical protein